FNPRTPAKECDSLHLFLFIAPILTMWLLSIMFSATTDTHVTIDRDGQPFPVVSQVPSTGFDKEPNKRESI
ncbi:hypothetical protein ACQ5R3_08125, partial [Limosilactobacillus fermentum]